MDSDIKKKFLKHMQEHLHELLLLEKQIHKERFDDIRVHHVTSHVHKIAGLCLTFDFKEEGNIARYVEMRLEKALKSSSTCELKEVLPLVQNLIKSCNEIIDGSEGSKNFGTGKSEYQDMHVLHNLGQGAHVFVADDDPVIRKLMIKQLEEQKFKVSSAKNGAEALEEIKKKQPDLVILDQNMPHMNGTDVCQSLLKEDTVKNVPVFLLSGYNAREFEQFRELENIKEVIEKPFKLGNILEKMKKYLS